LKDPNIKEYEVALDPLNADPTNAEMIGRTSGRTLRRKIATMKKEDVQYATMFEPRHSAYFASYFTITGLHGLHVLVACWCSLYVVAVSKRLYQRNPEHLANRVEVSGLFWHFVDLIWILCFRYSTAVAMNNPPDISQDSKEYEEYAMVFAATFAGI